MFLLISEARRKARSYDSRTFYICSRLTATTGQCEVGIRDNVPRGSEWLSFDVILVVIRSVLLLAFSFSPEKDTSEDECDKEKTTNNSADNRPNDACLLRASVRT